MNDPSTSPIDLLHTSACLCTALRRTARHLSAAYDRALSGAGLTSSQFMLLRRLADTGPVPIKSLAAAVGVDRTTLSRTLSLLCERGLIHGRTGDDRRVKWISLAPKGAAALERAEAGWLEVQRATVTAFGAERASELLRDLAALASTADGSATQPK